jgi:hypothetical protein
MPHEQLLAENLVRSLEFHFSQLWLNSAATTTSLTASFFVEELHEIAHLPDLSFSLVMSSKDSHRWHHLPLLSGCCGQLRSGCLCLYSFNEKMPEDPRMLT